MSKSPVREALVELCKDGVLINIPRMGYQVRAVTLKEIMDILEFRVDVEVGGLRKSFPVLTRENINMLRMIAEKHNADEDRIVSNNWQRNYEFHTYLYSLNNNVYGHQALQQMIHQCSRYISQYFLSAWQRKNESNGRYHMAVVDALENRTLKRPVCIWKRYTGSEGRDPGTAFYEHLIEYHLCTYKKNRFVVSRFFFFKNSNALQNQISQSISLTDLRMLFRDELRLLPSHEQCHGSHPG